MIGRRSPGSRALPTHTLLVYLFLYAPIVLLVILSFNAGRHATRWDGFSFKWYLALAGKERLIRAAVNSLIVGGIATVCSTIIGTLAAIGLSRFRFRGQGATRGLIYLPVVIPEIVLGVSLLSFYNAVGIRSMSLTTVTLAHIVFTVSYVTVVVKARLAGIDRSVEEAAMDLGAGPIAAFVKVTLPSLLPGILAAALMVCALSLDDYVVTSLVSGVGSQTLPVEIYSMLRAKVDPTTNAVCTVLLAATTLMVVPAQWLLSRKNT